jgi:2-dehydropantoate 2-reductase
MSRAGSRNTKPGPEHAAFAILGTGAIGSIIGAHLVRAGHSVAFLARGRRAQQLRSAGLRIRGLVEFACPAQAIVEPAQLRSAQVLIVATKAIGTVAALESLRQADIGVAFSVQNGVMKNELLSNAFGPAHVLGALADISGERLESGEVRFTRNENLLIGDLSAQTDSRARAIAATLDAAGVRSRIVPDIQSLEWSKFTAWVGLMVLAVTIRERTWKCLSDPDAKLLLARLVREIGVLARACGVDLSDESMIPVATICRASEEAAAAAVTAFADDLRLRAPEHRVSALQDLEAGRELEIEETLGFAVSTARRLQLDLPLLENFYRLARAIDRARNSTVFV